MRLIFHQPAGPGERFAPNAWDGNIGKEVPMRLPSGETRPARLVAAKVVDNGRGVDLTVELLDDPERGG